jgi:endonuclease YncB( thermonuclease family)
VKQGADRFRLYRSVGMIAIGLFVVLKVTTDIAGRSEALRGRAQVLDGDTITVEGVHVRLQGVAAPELDHAGLGIEQEPGGPEAAAFMRRLVEGQVVVCELTGERTHGREVGICSRAGRDIGAAVIEAGLARDCPRFSEGRYAELERPPAKSLSLPSYCERRLRPN